MMDGDVIKKGVPDGENETWRTAEALALVDLGGGLYTILGLSKIEKFMKQKKPKSTLLVDSTRGSITTNQSPKKWTI